eukprot:PhM_4_TR2881/c0_g1_i1/m.65351
MSTNNHNTIPAKSSVGSTPSAAPAAPSPNKATATPPKTSPIVPTPYAQRRMFAEAVRVVPDCGANARTLSHRVPCQIAVSVEHTVDGAAWVHVHVPDVPAFVPHNSALDRHAAQRQRSVYTPETSVTMLPHEVELGVCFPMNAPAPYPTITYSAKVDTNGCVIDSVVAPSVVRALTVMTYSQADMSHHPSAAWRLVRDVANRSFLRRVSNGAAAVDFDAMCTVEVQSKGTHCVTHEMLLQDPACLARIFGAAPVRVSMSRRHQCPSHYIVRELEVLAGEAAHIWFSRRRAGKYLHHGPSESCNLIAKCARGIALPDGYRGDVFTYICDVLRDPITHAGALRDLYHTGSGLGTTHLPVTNPLGHYAQLHVQNVVHTLHNPAAATILHTYFQGSDFEAHGIHNGYVEARVDALHDTTVHTTRHVARWVRQQPVDGNGAVRRMQCVVLHRTPERTRVFAPFLGYVCDLVGPSRRWGASDLVFVPLNVLVETPSSEGIAVSALSASASSSASSLSCVSSNFSTVSSSGDNNDNDSDVVRPHPKPFPRLSDDRVRDVVGDVADVVLRSLLCTTTTTTATKG